MSPMCQYSSQNGLPNSWHLAHLGSRAAYDLGLVMTEATAVSAEGRISPADLGIWSDSHAEAFKPITELIHNQGATAAIQLAHAGRKASHAVPWQGSKSLPESDQGWQTWAPQAIPYSAESHTPRAMDDHEEHKVLQDFVNATERSLVAGFRVVEIHMAHGYLLHEFLSPLSNPGKDLQERMRFPLLLAQSVRKVWPQSLPLMVRISATDWAQGGWDLEQSTVFCRALKHMGVDFIDCSSGGLVPFQKIDLKPHYQVPFAAHIKEQTGLATGAVGLITEAHAAESILREGQADAVFLGRELLRNPSWAIQASQILQSPLHVPVQYQRAY